MDILPTEPLHQGKAWMNAMATPKFEMMFFEPTWTSEVFSGNENAAALWAEDLSADSAVVLPPEGGEASRALVALDRNRVRHPVLEQSKDAAVRSCCKD